MSDIKFKPRSEFWLTRLLNKLGAGTYWLTYKDTIYYPDAIVNPHMFPEIIEHEKVHIEQYKKYGTFLFLFLYIFVLPIGFSYFRWRFEREAYLTQMKYMMKKYKNMDARDLIDTVVKSLWYGYGFIWPKFLMDAWFSKQLKEYLH